MVEKEPDSGPIEEEGENFSGIIRYAEFPFIDQSLVVVGDIAGYVVYVDSVVFVGRIGIV